MDKTSFIILTYFLATIAAISCLSSGDKCRSKFGDGQCINIKECRNAIEIARLNDGETLKKMLCGYNKTTPMVCCPEQGDSIVFLDKGIKKILVKPSPSWLWGSITSFTNEKSTNDVKMKMERTTRVSLPADPFPSRHVCGRITSNGDKIVGGQIADIDEYPWLARIKYRHRFGKEMYACSASLITDRFLLSAAHCLTNKIATPISVRLGEWDEQTKIDCQNNHCIDEPVDIRISETIIHPLFQGPNNIYADIALIKLQEPVKFTDYISPICLPTTEYVKMQDYVRDSSYWTAGWGITEFSTVSHVLRKVNLLAVPSDICTSLNEDIPAETFSQLICAGGRKGKDSCRGDSGGPLMREVREEDQTNIYLFGITSSGAAKCGSEGVPGFYTRVSNYMSWIRENVRNG